MQINFNIEGKVKINTSQYVRDMLKSFEYKMELREKVKTPADEHLFKINKNAKKLDKKKAKVFHTTVAKGLLLC